MAIEVEFVIHGASEFFAEWPMCTGSFKRINRASGLLFVVVFNEAQAGDKNDAKYSRKMYDASKGTGRNDQRGVLKNEKDSEKKYIRSARVKNLRTGDAGILSK